MTAHHDLRSELKLELTEFVAKMADFERSFSASGALMNYGTDFPLRAHQPAWLRMGEKHNCFNNATAYAVARNDVWYAEGYAMEPELPFPVQHSWLIDGAGEVIDPTWADTSDHVYFGIAFRQDFVRSMLALCGDRAGILVNMHLLRRHHREPGKLEEALIGGALNAAV